MTLTSTPRTAVEPAQSANKLFDALAHPERQRGLRVPKFPSMVPTATTQNNVFGTVETTTGSTDTTLVLMRDICYPLWVEYVGGVETGSVLASWDYVAGWGCPQAGVGSTSYETTCDHMTYSRAGNIGIGGEQPLVVGGAVPPFSNWSSAGVTAYSGPVATFPDMDHPDSPFLFVPAGAHAVLFGRVNLTGLVLASMNIEVDVANTASEDILVHPFTALTISGNMAYSIATFTSNMWLRVKSVSASFPALGGSAVVGAGIFVTNSAAQPTVTLTNNVNTTITVAGAPTTNKLLVPANWARPVNVLGFSTRPFETTFPTGFRLTLENVTKVVNREGMITAASFNTDTQTPQAIADAPFTYIAAAPAERKGRWAAEHGLTATVMTPQTLAEQRSNLYIISTAAAYGYVPTACIRNNDWASVIVITDADSATPSGFSASLTYTWEYVSNTQFVESKLTSSKLEDLRSAVLRLGSNPLFGPLERGSHLMATGIRPPRPPRQPKSRKAVEPPAKKPKPKPKAGASKKPPPGWHPPMTLPK